MKNYMYEVIKVQAGTTICRDNYNYIEKENEEVAKMVTIAKQWYIVHRSEVSVRCCQDFELDSRSKNQG